jgi:eukaryotic-like serine/threonine-protein kinase
MNQSSPTSLGKFQVVSEIARSGMGIVYRGYDPLIDRPVALKVALADALNDPESGPRYRKMFFNEARTAGQLRHPNILEVFDAGVDGDTCYIVMEYINGGQTLRQFCRPDNLLPVNDVVELIFKCAKALDYAHKQGVIHRDIKPSNLLFTEHRDVKVADFSIAHMTGLDNTQTMPMGFMGSPRYMSPEQIQQDYLNHQTDLFSLGVVMYEMLTGQHPFAAPSFSKLLHNVINQDPPPMSHFRPELPAGLENIVRKAIQKESARRFKTGLDFASALSTVCSYLERPQREVGLAEKFNDIQQLSFFGGFQESELNEILRASIWQDFAPGAAIIAEGDIDDCFYIVTAGSVMVRKGDKLVNRLVAGDCFGEMSYITKSKRTASIFAETSATVMKINATLIEQISPDCQLRFCKAFLRTLIGRLSHTTALSAENRRRDRQVG